jgi:hypothetical protein
MNPDCNPFKQLARRRQLEELYAADGRLDPAHPRHGTYTGLMVQERVSQREELIREVLIAWSTRDQHVLEILE